LNLQGAAVTKVGLVRGVKS